MQPIKLEIFLDDKTLAGMKSVEGNVAAMETFTKQMIDHLKLQLKGLEAQYKVLQKQGLTGDRELADIQAMQGAIGGLKDQLKELQKIKQQTNETPIMANDPAPKLNHVKMSMAQIARELPAIAMGPQMFFLAISNNIPMFTDAIGNARQEYERLTAAGQKAMPVWKQVLSSLFSWQTVMATAITLTVVYGKEIGQWFSSFSKGANSINVTTESLKGFHKAMADGEKNAQKEQTHLNLLYNAAINTAKGTNERKRAVQELKKEYPDYFGKLDEEVILLGDAKVAYDKLSASILATAKARAAEETIGENSKKILGLDDQRIGFLVKQTQAQRGLDNDKTLLNNLKGNPEAYDFQLKIVEAARKKVKEYGAQADKAAQQIELLNKTNERLAGTININDLIKDKKKEPTGKIPVDYQTELSEARLRAQQKVEAVRIAIMVEGRDKRKAIAQKEYNEAIAAIDKEERDTLAKLEKSKKAGKKVTPEEEQQVKNSAASQRTLAQLQHVQSTYNIEKEWREKNQQAWIDYNKEYGTTQEKRLAIAQDYALKIGQAETEAEKAGLKKKRDEDLKEFDFTEFKKTVNLADVFGNLDEQSTETLSVLRDKLKEYINGAAKELRPSDLKELQNALTDIDLKLTDRKPFKELKKSLADYQASQEAVEKAQADLNTVMAGGEVIIGTYTDETGKVITKLLTQTQAEKNLRDAQSKRMQKQTGLAQSLAAVGGEMSSYGQAANTIISTLEGFGVEVDENVKGVVEGFNTMSEGVSQFAQSLLTMDIGGMISGVVNTVGGVLKSVGSLFGADWGGERSTRRYEQAKERYESYMSVLDKVIAKQRELVESMEVDNIENATNSYKQAGKLLKEQQSYAREMGKAYLNSGASTGFLGIGSSASEGVKQRDGISSSAWEQARKVLGTDYTKVADGRMTGLFDLSYEKLVKLHDEASGFWSELHEDTRNYLEQIIESEEAWQEVQEARKEAMTGLSFDNLRSSFLETLMDMDSSTADFADNFEKYMQRAMLNSMLSESYNSRLKQWYDSFAGAMEEKTERNGKGFLGIGKRKVVEKAGVLNEQEYKELQDSWDKIVDDALAERDALKDIFGWKGEEETSSQSGRAGAFTTMSQEQGTKLEGLFTSLQDHASGIHQLLQDLMQGRNADHELWVQIAENTAYCKYLETISEIMEYIKLNGVKMQ